MCGVSYCLTTDARTNAIPIVLSISEALEPRGYDAAGIAWHNPTTGLFSSSKVGHKDNRPVAVLRKQINGGVSSSIALGHTRQRTIGDKSARNAHPFRVERVVGCGNGDITNYRQLEAQITHVFGSEVDTERAVALVAKILGDKEGLDALEDAVLEASSQLEGEFALAFVLDEAEGVVFLRKGVNSLFLGRPTFGWVVGSTVESLTQFDGPIAELPQGVTKLCRSSEPELSFIHYDASNEEEANEFSSRMELEIHRQAQIVARLVSEPLNCPLFPVEELLILGCGSSEHVGRFGGFLLNKVGIPAHVVVADQFGERPRFPKESTKLVGISQSGGTADLNVALSLAQSEGFGDIIAVTNTPTSVLANRAAFVAHLGCGEEKAVASTMVVTATAVTFAKMARCFRPDAAHYPLDSIPALVEALLSSQVKDQCQAMAEKLYQEPATAWVGTGVNLYAAREAWLKDTEMVGRPGWCISEKGMKHGPIGVMAARSHFPVIGCTVGSFDRLPYEQMKGRGARLFGIVEAGNPLSELFEGGLVTVPFVDSQNHLGRFISCVIVAQFLALMQRKLLGLDIDRIDGLSKAVSTC